MGSRFVPPVSTEFSSEHEYLIGGIKTKVLGIDEALNDLKNHEEKKQFDSVGIVFFVHCRGRDSLWISPVAHEALYRFRSTNVDSGKLKCLLGVLIDDRNHGTRMLDALANEEWVWANNNGRPLNNTHAQDMMSTIIGTSSDIELVKSFLPSYLPQEIVSNNIKWGVTGVSLGGHVTYYLLSHGKNVTKNIDGNGEDFSFLAPVVGCPTLYLMLEERFVKQKNLLNKFESSIGKECTNNLQDEIRWNKSLQDLILYNSDNANIVKGIGKGKYFLIQTGEDDNLVPDKYTRDWVDSFAKNEEFAFFKYIVEPHTGHRLTPRMIENISQGIIQWLGN